MEINIILFLILYSLFNKTNNNLNTKEFFNIYYHFKGIVYAISIISIYCIILIISGYTELQYNRSSLSYNLTNFIVLLITHYFVALFEEYAFRFALFEVIGRVLKSKTLRIIIVGIMFTSMHYFNYKNIPFNISDYLSAFLISVLFSSIYLKYKSITIQVSFHAWWNSFLISLNLDKEQSVMNNLLGFSFVVVDLEKIYMTLSLSIILIIACIYVVVSFHEYRQ